MKMEKTEINTKRYRIVGMFLTILFGVLMLNFLIDNFVYNQTQLVTFDFRKVILFLIPILCVMFFVTAKGHWEKCGRWKRLLVTGVIVVLQVMAAAASLRTIGWDCGMVLGLAEQLNVWNKVEASYYLAQYPNNAFLVCFWRDVFAITGRFGINCWLVAVGINLVCIDCAVYLVCRICRKIWDEKVELCALIFSTIMLGFSFWNVIPYTDTLSMPVPLILFLLFLKIKESEMLKKILYAALFGVLCCVGYMLKPTNILVVIAMVLVMLLQIRLDKKQILRAGTVLVAAGLAFGVTSGLFQLHKKAVYGAIVTEEDEYNSSVDMLHYLKMGMKEPYGSYNQEDVDMMFQIVGKDNKHAYNMQMIEERLKEHGFIGYLKFLYKKGSFVYTDGTFGFGGEGTFYTSNYFWDAKGPFAMIREMRTYGTRYYMYWSCHLAEALWSALLGYMFVGTVVDWRREKQVEVLILRTAILGIIAFLLLFEARSRYLLNHLPIMIILASDGCVKLNSWIQKHLNKTEERK